MKHLERAEQYGGEEIVQMHSIYPYIIDLLKNFFTEHLSLNHPLFLCASKGTGKTWNVMKALNELYKEQSQTIVPLVGDSFKPLMLIYKEEGHFTSLAEDKINSTSMSIKKVNGSLTQRIERSNPIILDDVHYICEDIMAGHLHYSEFINLLKLCLRRVEEGAKVLLISEDLLSGYSALLGLTELDDLLPAFGMNPLYKLTPSKNYLSFREMGQPNKADYIQLFESYGITADEDVINFLFSSTSRPRAFIKFFNQFPSQKITFLDVLTEAMRRIDEDIQVAEELIQIQTRFRSYRTKSLKSKLKILRIALSNFQSIKSIGLGPEIFHEFEEKFKNNLELFFASLPYIEKIIEVATKKLSIPKKQKSRWHSDLGYRLRHLDWWEKDRLLDNAYPKVYTPRYLTNQILSDFIGVYIKHPLISRNARRVKRYNKRYMETKLNKDLFNIYRYFTLIEDRWLPIKPLQTLFNDELYGDIPSLNLMRVKGYEQIYNKNTEKKKKEVTENET